MPADQLAMFTIPTYLLTNTLVENVGIFTDGHVDAEEFADAAYAKRGYVCSLQDRRPTVHHVYAVMKLARCLANDTASSRQNDDIAAWQKVVADREHALRDAVTALIVAAAEAKAMMPVIEAARKIVENYFAYSGFRTAQVGRPDIEALGQALDAYDAREGE